MKKFVLTVLLASISFATLAHAQEAVEPLPADVAIKCMIIPYDSARTRIPEQPLAEVIIKKTELAALENKSVSLGSIEGLAQVNFEIQKDIEKYNPEGNISMAFMETNARGTSSLVLAGGSMKSTGVSGLLYRSAHSQQIYMAFCQKQ